MEEGSCFYVSSEDDGHSCYYYSHKEGSHVQKDALLLPLQSGEHSLCGLCCLRNEPVEESCEGFYIEC